jgi:hypothetical protein
MTNAVSKEGTAYASAVVPKLFHLRAPWQPISINRNLHISKMFDIKIVAVFEIYIL